MAQAINVIIEYPTSAGLEQFNVNNEGLVSMTFERFLGNPDNKKSEVLSRIDITMFDKSGIRLLSIMQKAKAKLRIKYGFENNMSEVYDLSINKFKSTFNNLGCMVSIGAYGRQVDNVFLASIYQEGTLINDILVELAERNNWYTGPNNSFINCGNLKLPSELLKPADKSDIDFIMSDILELCNLSVTVANDDYTQKFWDVKLFQNGSKTVFTFQPFGTRIKNQRVWSYSYGDTTSSSVISFTNTVDYSFLLKGLTIKVPASLIEIKFGSTAGEIQERLATYVFKDKWAYIQGYLSKYGLPVPSEDEFSFNVELIPTEDSDSNLGTIEDRVISGIRQAISSLNSMELTVIGNPKILPTDLIHLTVMNRPNEDGKVHENIATGYWKVVTIKEEIGLSGYTTVLGLVRDIPDIYIPKTPSKPLIE